MDREPIALPDAFVALAASGIEPADISAGLLEAAARYGLGTAASSGTAAELALVGLMEEFCELLEAMDRRKSWNG